jgi:hypothetical protein
MKPALDPADSRWTDRTELRSVVLQTCASLRSCRASSSPDPGGKISGAVLPRRGDSILICDRWVMSRPVAVLRFQSRRERACRERSSV